MRDHSGNVSSGKAPCLQSGAGCPAQILQAIEYGRDVDLGVTARVAHRYVAKTRRNVIVARDAAGWRLLCRALRLVDVNTAWGSSAVQLLRFHSSQLSRCGPAAASHHPQDAFLPAGGAGEFLQLPIHSSQQVSSPGGLRGVRQISTAPADTLRPLFQQQPPAGLLPCSCSCSSGAPDMSTPALQQCLHL